MIKKYAFILAVFITLLIAFNYTFFNTFSTKEIERENAKIERIIDGDTLELSDGRKVRLVNINSPEKGSNGYNLSINFLKEFENKTIELEIIGLDKYKRTLARIYSSSYLNLEIVNLGLASKFLVQESELSDFSKAEESAIKNSLGIWKKSKFSGCFSSKINSRDELVLITNECEKINVKGWIIKDESRKIYTFNNLELRVINIHSGQGIDNETDIFWASKTDVWNNDRDSLYLFDSEGGIAHYETYGY